MARGNAQKRSQTSTRTTRATKAQKTTKQKRTNDYSDENYEEEVHKKQKRSQTTRSTTSDELDEEEEFIESLSRDGRNEKEIEKEREKDRERARREREIERERREREIEREQREREIERERREREIERERREREIERERREREIEREREQERETEREKEAAEESEREEESAAEENERGGEREKSENDRIPQFEDQLQICNWLVDHPDVIKVACQMLDMKNQAASSSSVLPTLAPSPLTSEGNDEGNDSYRLLDEELKILFLKTRNPPDHVFVKLVHKIFNLAAHKGLASRITKKCRTSFSDYRYSFKGSLDKLLESFLKTKSGDVLLPNDVNNFISREVVFKKILKRHIASVDISELSNQVIDKLVDLCRKCFTIVWEERGSENKIIYNRIQLLDVETEELIIPSRSGTNVVATLKFR